MNAGCAGCAARRQGGQAMVEMVAGLGIVFVAGFMAMAMLGKLNDVRNKVLIGSRYVAWERTVWTNPDDADTGSDGWWYRKFGLSAQSMVKTDDALAHEFMARVAAPRRSSLTSSDGNVGLAEAMPPSWRDPGGVAFIGSMGDIEVSTRATDHVTGGLAKIANNTIGVYRSPDVSQEVGLQMASRTLQAGRVSVDVGLNGEFMQRLWPDLKQLTFQDATSLVSNTWTPDGRLGLVTAIGPKLASPAAMPNAMLTASDKRALIAAEGGARDLLEKFKPGYIAPDVVPKGVLK